jgi:hypothetical protein
MSDKQGEFKIKNEKLGFGAISSSDFGGLFLFSQLCPIRAPKLSVSVKHLS